MMHLGKAYAARRFVHSSPHMCLWASAVHSERECLSSANKPISLDSGLPVSDSESKITSPVSEATLLESSVSVSASEYKVISPASEATSESKESIFPDEPTTCCMSGCANCVWIEYADQVCKLFKSGEKAKEMVLSKVSDPNMKAFLLMELKALENRSRDKTS